MRITNITDKKAPKPIGIGTITIMPGESDTIPDEVAYVDEFDRNGNRTGKKIILPSIRLMEGLGQMTFEETKKEVKTEKPAEEAEPEKAEPAEEKPATRRGRRKAE